MVQGWYRLVVQPSPVVQEYMSLYQLVQPWYSLWYRLYPLGVVNRYVRSHGDKTACTIWYLSGFSLYLLQFRQVGWATVTQRSRVCVVCTPKGVLNTTALVESEDACGRDWDGRMGNSDGEL